MDNLFFDKPNSNKSNPLAKQLKEKISEGCPGLKFHIKSGTKITVTKDIGGVPAETHIEGLTLELGYFSFNNAEQAEKVLAVLSEHPGITSLLAPSGQLGWSLADGNYIASSKGGDAIAAFLEKDPELKVLDIHYNHIPKDGILAIIESLKGNNHLDYLNIRANDIDYEVLEALLDVVTHHNTSLKSVELTQNNFLEEKAQDDTLISNIYNQLKMNHEPAQAQCLLM